MYKKTLVVSIKIFLTAVAIYLVYHKMDFTKTKEIFDSINYFWLSLAFILFTLSRVVGAVRLNLYFSQIGLQLSQILNLKLYYLGMFYNLFLPGGIGGDGYKIFFLHKHYQTKRLQLLKATLLDRISGLFALLFLVCIFLSASSFMEILHIKPLWCLIAAVCVIPTSYLFASVTFKTFMPIFSTSTLYALILQALQGLTALFILYAFAESSQISNYLTIFFISSVVAVLPLSIGGIGARELTFIYLLEFLQQDYSVGVALSVMFFIFTFISSLWGVLYMHIRP